MENEEEEASNNVHNPSPLLEPDLVTTVCDTQEELQNTEPQCHSVPELDESQLVHAESESPPPTVAEKDGEDVIAREVNQVVVGGGDSPPPPQSTPRLVADKGGKDVIAGDENQAIEGRDESPSPPPMFEGGDGSLPPPPTVFGKDGDDVIAGEEKQVVVGSGESSSPPVSGGEDEDVKSGEERTERQAVDREMETEAAVGLVAEEMETAVSEEEVETEVAAVADTVTEVANLVEDTVVIDAAKDMVVAEVKEDDVLVETAEEETVVADMLDVAEDREVADMVEETEVTEAAEETTEGAVAAEETTEGAEAAEETTEGAEAAEETSEEAEAAEEATEGAEDVAEMAEERDAAGETEVAEMAEEREVVHMADETEMAEMAEETDVAEAAYETDMAEMGEETDVAEMVEEAEMEVADETEMAEETEVAEEASRSGGGKRKRGKNSRATARVPVRKTVEEDVCFICFDGGDLVLCDRRGCPKAYHPSCVNRDEAFFRAKGRWNCGWHLCSNCEKNAHYMCYTCTFSLCKGCVKDAVIFCVRGNKGFCETCMKTVMLIEKNEQGNKEMSQVDFDDKSSWEYLFKDYWIDLKGRLSLTLDELARAKNPWKGSDVLADKQESPADHYLTNNEGSDSDGSFGNVRARISKRRKGRKHDSNNDGGSGSDSSGNAGARISKRRKGKKRLKSLAKEGSSISIATVVGAEGASKADSIEWASKELLEFVMHMKDGDKSLLSQFDVQALLLEYIKRNKLRDPRRKSQIICDSRLENLFGKPRVGHFEMLKLLESHFLIREDSQADDLQGSVVDTNVNPLEADGNPDALVKAGKDKRRKTRKKGDERGSQSNLDDYAAIDMHNINLIYLRRNLVEDLIEDTERFHDKVVGSFVRIRISGCGQKQDLYRLVQVVGTSKAAEPYKVGKRMTNITLEILNLNKTEVISIDIISNQEFTEDECKRLRQSIKCGLINRMTVGNLQEKAMELQAARVKDSLETEIVRLSHLRDRASDLGRRKELRECVEKLQLLRMPEERQRRLEEIPEIHVDPNMDPSYESEEDEDETDDKKQENYMRPRGTGFSRRGMEPISPRKGGSVSNDSWGGTRAFSSMNRELSRNMSNKGLLNKGDDGTGTGEIVNENSWNQGKDRETQQSDSWEKPKTALSSETGARNSHSVIPESFSGVVSETSPAPLSAGVAQSAAKISETDKMWHYKDPAGKVQGPFSIVQLRKWSNTGYFPTDLRIWRTTEKQDDSILLTDVLTGKFEKEPLLVDNSFPKAQMGQTPNLSSSYSGKPYGTPLQQGREGQSAGASWRLEPEISSSKGRATPSVDVSKYSTDGWSSDYGSRNDSTNLPSPTPSQTTAGGTRGQGYENKWLPNPFSVQPQGLGNGVLQPPISVIPESGQLTHSSALPSPIKPSGGADGSNVANATFSQQATVPGNKEHNRMEYLGVPSGSNSGGQLVRGSENDHLSSLPGVSQAPRPERGVLLSSTNALQNPSLTTMSGESHRVQGDAHLLLASDLATASMNPGADIIKNSGASLQNLVVSVSNHNPPADTHGWGSGSVPKPETIASHQIPGSESQGWGGTPPQKTDSNNPNHMPAQPPAYGHRGDTPSSVPNSASSFVAGNPAGIFPSQGFTGLPPSDPWRPPVLGNQSNIQPPAPPNLPWGMGVTDNSNTAQRPGVDNQNAGWGSMPGNPNMGWRGPVPGNANMNWGASGQGSVPGNVNPVWTAPGQGPAPGNTNPGWAAPGQGPVPGNANPGWVAPSQGPLPGTANPAWVAPQGPHPGNANPAWVAPTGNTGMWGSEQNQNGDRFSSQRDRSSQGGDSGYGGGRPWNRQSSFGSGGSSSRPPFKGQGHRVCKFHENGHCKKGASCDYLHT